MWGHAARADSAGSGSSSCLMDPGVSEDLESENLIRTWRMTLTVGYPETGIESIPPALLVAMLQAIVAACRAPPRGCSPCPTGKSSGPSGPSPSSSSGPSRPGGEATRRQMLENSSRAYSSRQVDLYGILHQYVQLHMHTCRPADTQNLSAVPNCWPSRAHPRLRLRHCRRLGLLQPQLHAMAATACACTCW